MALLCQLRDFFAGGAVLRHRQRGRVRRAGTDCRSKERDAGRNIMVIEQMVEEGGTILHGEVVRWEREVEFAL